MKILKENLSNMIVCVFELCVGILLLVDPFGFMVGIIAAAGVVLIIIGLIYMIKYFATEPLEAAFGQFLFKGLLSMLVGIFCMSRAQWFITTFPILTIIYALAILAAGIGKIQWTVDMIRMKRVGWNLSAISAVLSVACAIIILANPFDSTEVLWRFTAVVLILEAVFDIIVLIRSKIRKNSPEKKYDEEPIKTIEDKGGRN